MKRIIDHVEESGKELRVDQLHSFLGSRLRSRPLFFLARYLILFLKFVSAIIPTVDYDYTISMDG